MDKSTAAKVVAALQHVYGEPQTALEYKNEFQLLVAVILSAQCTDARVNKITPALFDRYGTPEAMADADIEEVKKLIFSCGFYNSKAKNIISAARDIVERHRGRVPSEREELVKLAGVGRKTANVVFAVAFGGQAMPVDTHVFRIAHRLGMSEAATPDKTELDITNLLNNGVLTLAHHLFITHGRVTCHARKPACPTCAVREYCKYYEQNYQ